MASHAPTHVNYSWEDPLNLDSQLTDDERAVIDRHWFDMRLPKNDDAVPLIRRDARAARLERLYLISWQQIYHRVGASGRAKLKRKHD